AGDAAQGPCRACRDQLRTALPRGHRVPGALRHASRRRLRAARSLVSVLQSYRAHVGRRDVRKKAGGMSEPIWRNAKALLSDPRMARAYASWCWGALTGHPRVRMGG